MCAVVAFGLELVLIGVFFVPIALWIGTGDLRIARQHAGDEARRLFAALRTWHRSTNSFWLSRAGFRQHGLRCAVC